MDLENVWHVLPNNDWKPHVDGCSIDFSNGQPLCACPCKPKVVAEFSGFIIIHNSFDGREGLEWAEEILNKE